METMMVDGREKKCEKQRDEQGYGVKVKQMDGGRSSSR